MNVGSALALFALASGAGLLGAKAGPTLTERQKREQLKFKQRLEFGGGL